MNALYGEKLNKMDAKGRVIVPAMFRELMGEKLVLHRWLEKSIRVLTPGDFQAFMDKLNSEPSNTPELRAFKRMIFSSVAECSCDKLGRIRIPQNLQDHAGLDKSISFIGMGSTVEIWGTENWKAFNDTSESFEDLAVKSKIIF